MRKVCCLLLSFVWIGLNAQKNTVGNIHNTPAIKVSLNFYSFNSPLNAGEETIESVIDYCADIGFDALDITGYYFPGYPAVPSDDYINRIKYHAFRQGIQISGTGVRNDFTLTDPVTLEKEKQHVKDWIVVSAKLGAPVVRIFSGNSIPEGATWKETARKVAAAINECGEFAGKYGIILAIQNHNDFLKTAEEVEELFSMITSDAVGLMVDIGSYRTDPYREIEQTVKYAVSWQIKEDVYIRGIKTKTDIPKVMDIIYRSGYRGYVPIETLGKGNEKSRVKEMLQKIKETF